MNDFSPTLKCPCRWGFCESAFTYSARPEGETEFELGEAEYRRGYDRCTICDHYVSRHDMDLSKLYDGHYLDATYGGPGGMRKRLERILGLPYHESDNARREVAR